MDDDLYFCYGRRPQFFLKLKKNSICFWLEVHLKRKCNIMGRPGKTCKPANHVPVNLFKSVYISSFACNFLCKSQYKAGASKIYCAAWPMLSSSQSRSLNLLYNQPPPPQELLRHFQASYKANFQCATKH